MTASDTARRSNGGAGLVIVGALLALVAATLLVGGGALVVADQTQRDADGYYTTAAKTIATPTHARVSDRLDVGTDRPDWLFRKSKLGTIQVSATGTSSKPIFVGVAEHPRSTPT